MAQLPSNQQIAGVLDQIADLLELQEANPFRVRSYRDGASTIRQTDRPVAKMIAEGRKDELKDLPGIGAGLLGVMSEYVEQGKSETLQRLQSSAEPRQAFARIPGLGPELAGRVVEELGVKTFEELEQAAHDGRLASISGFGQNRIEAVKTSLAGILSGAAQSRIAGAQSDPGRQQPSIATLLAVDAEYRQKAAAGELRTIAPKRFNPDRVAWLPVLDTSRDGWNFTALFSNTARAHELGATRDWVVLYYERDGQEKQSTVVTATAGKLKGRRVVRGREADTLKHYQADE